MLPNTEVVHCAAVGGPVGRLVGEKLGAAVGDSVSRVGEKLGEKVGELVAQSYENLRPSNVYVFVENETLVTAPNRPKPTETVEAVPAVELPIVSESTPDLVLNWSVFTLDANDDRTITVTMGSLAVVSNL